MLWFSKIKVGRHWFEGNGLLLAGTKPLPGRLLIYHQASFAAFIWGQFHRMCVAHGINHKLAFENCTFKITATYPRVQWINTLWPSDVIWRQVPRSTLAQVMACCLTAPSHYLNQYWLMIREVLWHSPDSNFTENTWYLLLKWVWNLLIWDCSEIPHRPMS